MALWTSRHQQRDSGSERATEELLRQAGNAVPNLRGILCPPDEAGSSGTGALRPRGRGLHRRETALRLCPPFRMSLKTRIFRPEVAALRVTHRNVPGRCPNFPIGGVPPMIFSCGTSWAGCELVRCQPCKRKGQLWLKVTRTDSISSSVPSWSSWCCCLSSWAAARVAVMPRLMIRQRRPLRQTPKLLPKCRPTVPQPTHRQPTYRQPTHRQLPNKRDAGVTFPILLQKSIQGGAGLRTVFSNACRAAPLTGIGDAWSPVLFFGAFSMAQSMAHQSGSPGSDARLPAVFVRRDGLDGRPMPRGYTPCAAQDGPPTFPIGNQLRTAIPALWGVSGMSHAQYRRPGIIRRSGAMPPDDSIRQSLARMALAHISPFLPRTIEC